MVIREMNREEYLRVLAGASETRSPASRWQEDRFDAEPRHVDGTDG